MQTNNQQLLIEIAKMRPPETAEWSFQRGYTLALRHVTDLLKKQTKSKRRIKKKN